MPSKHRTILVTVTLVFTAVVVFALSCGPEGSDVGNAMNCMLQYTLHPFASELDSCFIIRDIRLPRILLGASVGASLALAGAGLQSLLRNPLAEPYLLGVSNGAALGTMLALIFFSQFELARPVMAFTGASLATFVGFQMAKSRAGMNVERLVLSGVIVTTFLSSILVLLTSLIDATKLRSFTFWLLGDLSQATRNGFYLSFAAVDQNQL